MTGAPGRTVRTVLGPVAPEQLGRVLHHEHLLSLTPGPWLSGGAAGDTVEDQISRAVDALSGLRALGFGRSPVVISVLIEALLLSLVGGLIGGGLAWLAFDGYQTATMNWQSFSQVAFAFRVTPSLLARGLIYAVAMGLLGGLLPAVRAARMPVVTALREL